MKTLRWVLTTLAAILLFLAVWAFWWEPRRLLVRNERLVLPGWQFPMRIVVLTDLHVGSPHNGPRKLSRIIDAANAARPDVVALLGDFVIQGVIGGNFVPPEVIADSLKRLQSRLGTYAVLGNHDWWLDAPRVRASLQRAGITVLEDSAAAIGTPDPAFWLAGVSDFWEGKHDVPATLRHVIDHRPVLLITHNPDIFPNVPARVALTLAGHTHGGQVRLPFVGAPVVPSRYGQRFAAGHVIEQRRHLFVATGTGMSILPVRFRVPPSVVVLDILPG